MVTMESTTKLGMDRQAGEIELVARAQQGDKESLNRLAEMGRERLRVYVYRLTQKDDLTQEIVQESLLEMCKVLGKLQKTDRFWPWLYGIATNKLHRHYRTEKAMRHAAASEERRQRINGRSGTRAWKTWSERNSNKSCPMPCRSFGPGTKPCW